MTSSGVVEIWRGHFSLAGDPFALTPDPSVLYLSEQHAEALAALKLGLLESRGLMVMIGEVGTGKTTVVYSLLSSLDSRIATAYVANTSLSFEEMLLGALQDFGVDPGGRRRTDLFEALNAFLGRCAEEGRTAALIVDEAHNLSDETFERLRLLLNFETYKQKLLQIVLLGQPELAERLAAPRLRQLADRIAVRCHLNPLSARDARGYLAYRLEAAGGSPEIFTPAARRLLVRKARGIPRRINCLGHNAMLFAYGRGLDRVDRPQVARAVRERAGRGLVRLRRWRLPAADLVPSYLTPRGLWLGAAAVVVLALAATVTISRARSPTHLSSSAEPATTAAVAREAVPPPLTADREERAAAAAALLPEPVAEEDPSAGDPVPEESSAHGTTLVAAGAASSDSATAEPEAAPEAAQDHRFIAVASTPEEQEAVRLASALREKGYPSAVYWSSRGYFIVTLDRLPRPEALRKRDEAVRAGDVRADAYLITGVSLERKISP